MEAKIKELAIAITIADLHNTNIVNFLPVGTTYLSTLAVMKRKKLIIVGERMNWTLTDKGRMKYLSDVVPVNPAMAKRFEQVEEFVNNL